MAGQLTIDTLKASTGVLATQNGMTGIAKAWVNFTGSSATINGSFNVSSITRTGTGTYTVTYTTAMPNATYATAGLVGDGVVQIASIATGTATVGSRYLTGSYVDQTVQFVVFNS